MVITFLKMTLRNMRKHRFYAITNVAGLSVGIAASILIGLYVYDELTFDRFHKDNEEIYQVGLHINFGGQEFKTFSSCPPLARAMVSTIPGVEQVTRIKPWHNVIAKTGDKAFTETKVLLADPNFFDFFSFRLVEGNIKTVLTDANTVVLTETTARKYFGDDSALGKLIALGNDNVVFTVTGIASQPPANSHIQFDMIASAESNRYMRAGRWGDTGLYTYYRKNRLADLESVSSKLRSLVQQHIAPELEASFGVSYQQFTQQGGIYTFLSYPLSDTHLYYPEINDGLSPTGDIKYVCMIGAIGMFVMLIACINFMNLATARSAGRAKEVGLRKTLGSKRSALIGQFLSESSLYVSIALVVALISVYLLLPAFNLLAGKALVFSTLWSPPVAGSLAVVFITVTLLAGAYPAFYLTSFKPVDVLKGHVRSGIKSKRIRSALVVIQFTISIALSIATVVVYQQLRYLHNKNIGLDKQNVLILKNTNLLKTNREAFQDAVHNQREVIKASYTNNVFPGISDIGAFRAVGTTKDVLFADYYADHNHLEVLKINLAQGRFFAERIASDSLACVVNEAAVRELGWTDPLKEKLMIDASPPFMQVIGVVKDFNFESFKSPVKPLVILPLQIRSDNLLVRYRGDAKAATGTIEKLWKQFAPNQPYEFAFLDQNFDELFRTEQKLGQVFTAMSSIALFVACIGLLGLASFTAEQRTKEIAIRKVLGASVASVNATLGKEFMILVGLSFVVASIIAWYVLDKWLDNFAYRIPLHADVFLIAGLAAAAIAWITVSFQFIRAAQSNPVTALRSE